jgi:DNA-binding HxlR family transcriptional regulator
MPRTDFGRMQCSIAKAVDVLGDAWTPLVLRDLLLGFTRFDDIQRDLGIATNVLSERLTRLLDHGVVARRPYGTHPNRFEYQLTDKGRDAIPIVLLMLAWGDRWELGRAGKPTEVLHTTCGHVTHAVAHCSKCGERLALEDLEYHRGPGNRRTPGTQLLRDRLGPPLP